MEDSIAVSVKNVSKKFRLFGSPKDRLREALHPFKRKYHHEFWALKDISFEVPRGMTLGIIGRNGSGKSTLLQIICSVLRPTLGTVKVNGRISALLELGAGFNPEFTGRDNVLLNGALMGFSRGEMQERLPIIEAFADIGEFIDQPVKIYSSGMFVRLAFAAAINVDPDILIVDEALAVGDAKFQHKCYGKFLEFQKAGKTIIFVTHDTNAVIKHCNRVILLEKGGIIQDGKPSEVVNSYIEILERKDDLKSQIAEFVTKTSDKNIEIFLSERVDPKIENFLKNDSLGDNCPIRNSYNKNECRQGNRSVEIIDYLIVNSDHYDPVMVNCGEFINLYLKVAFYKFVQRPVTGFSLKTVDGITLLGFNSTYIDLPIHSATKGETVVFKFSIKMNLPPGDYFFDLGIAEEVSLGNIEIFDRRCSIAHLRIESIMKFDGLVYLDTTLKEICRGLTK